MTAQSRAYREKRIGEIKESNKMKKAEDEKNAFTCDSCGVKFDENPTQHKEADDTLTFCPECAKQDVEKGIKDTFNAIKNKAWIVKEGAKWVGHQTMEDAKTIGRIIKDPKNAKSHLQNRLSTFMDEHAKTTALKLPKQAEAEGEATEREVPSANLAIEDKRPAKTEEFKPWYMKKSGPISLNDMKKSSDRAAEDEWKKLSPKEKDAKRAEAEVENQKKNKQNLTTYGCGLCAHKEADSLCPHCARSGIKKAVIGKTAEKIAKILKSE
jgi:hypothetical protein